jgi:putative PIN family toxin of toxin-antitoxin system
LDTNVLIAAARSGRGVSARLLSLVGTDRFDIYISVPLVLEYEDVLSRHVPRQSPRFPLWQDILDYLCSVGMKQRVFFLWRPILRDPKDDMILELAVAGQCDVIVTYNRRDFQELERFALRVLEPKEFLQEIGELS